MRRIYVRLAKVFRKDKWQKNIRAKQTNQRKMGQNGNNNKIDMKYASSQIDLKFCKSRRKGKLVDICLQRILSRSVNQSGWENQHEY